MRAPAATYRIQLSGEMRFADVQRMVGYLDSLGVSDVYCSPILAAREGSPHGYDISDHGRINPELGGGEDLRALSATLRARGMGLIADIVPNHMGADANSNRWWRDVLENGPSSPYARFFDIDWQPGRPELHNKVLLPILGGLYGDVLARGELQLDFVDDAFVVRYFDRLLPVDPKQAGPILAAVRAKMADARDGRAEDLSELDEIDRLLDGMPDHTSTTPQASMEREDVRRALGQRLATLVRRSEPVRRSLHEALDAINGRPGDRGSFDDLHALLDRQPYRLAFWRRALDDINDRRFVDVNELAGLRVESPAVFAAAHALVLDLIEERIVSGIRVDHPDGLFDPAAYFRALRDAVRTRIGDDDLYVVAEKVLGRGERLRPDWEVQGTTGYNALTALNGLFVHPQGLANLRRTYKRIARFQRSGADTTHDAKELMIQSALASELKVLAVALSRLAERDRNSRDFTITALTRALIDIIASFPVYRTYVTEQGAGPDDTAVVDAAIADARRRDPLQEPSVFEFVRQALLPLAADAADLPAQEHFRERLSFARKFQQYTAAVSAKSLEDTAFYNDVLLLSTNEVGGDLERRTRSVQEFHDDNLARLADWPLEMTAASTHDTKRGEDARLRISVIPELEDEWRQHVSRWVSVNRHAHTDVGGTPAPDRNDEWMFYQALVGAWPAERLDVLVPASADCEFVERMRRFMRKAIKEAKRHTSWLYENAEYERATDGFVQQVLSGTAARRFLSSFVPFARRLAWFGMFGSLSQLVLRLMAPGVPDIYQGSELWNLDMVDPDNRRRVDFAGRCQLLTSLEPILARPDPAALARLLDQWADGRLKMYTMAAALRQRKSSNSTFLQGTYHPLFASHEVNEHIVAFARQGADREVVVAVPRFVATLVRESHRLPLGRDVWGYATLQMPPHLAGVELVNAFTGERLRPTTKGGLVELPLAQLFATWPVAMLVGYPH
jgi:(1->4)-alpha-D-glucan 1-alpha-D-glucosylmutase